PARQDRGCNLMRLIPRIKSTIRRRRVAPRAGSLPAWGHTQMSGKYPQMRVSELSTLNFGCRIIDLAKAASTGNRVTYQRFQKARIKDSSYFRPAYAVPFGSVRFAGFPDHPLRMIPGELSTSDGRRLRR